MPSKKTKNPFYTLLLVVGGVFAITACVYMVMTVKGLQPVDESNAASSSSLMTFMDEHGFTLLMVELGLLAVCTIGAIATDEMWGEKPQSNVADANATALDDHDATTDS